MLSRKVPDRDISMSDLTSISSSNSNNCVCIGISYHIRTTGSFIISTNYEYKKFPAEITDGKIKERMRMAAFLVDVVTLGVVEIN